MKKLILSFTILIVCGTVVTCGVVSTNTVTSPSAKLEDPTQTATLPTSTTQAPASTSTPTPFTPTITPMPEGKTITVTSADDSGPGTLRQALQDAEIGDTITFDPIEFPPNDPIAIQLKSGLPQITQGYLTLDASNAGVILDGSQAGGEWTAGIELDSEHNIIRGLQVVHFTGPGILLDPNARYNLVGGDQTIGAGPLGQGNLFSDNSDGVGIRGSDNTITGNLIGTDVTGLGKMGNRAPGVFLEENASHNVIGPDNIIAYNGTVGGGGVEIRSINAKANVITANSIHSNSFAGINGSTHPGMPVILDFDLASGMVEGITCPGCMVEIFSTSKGDGEVYEGSVTASQGGSFTLNTGTSFTGPSLTATATDVDNSTSMFSPATTGTSRTLIIQKDNSLPRSLIVTKQSSELEDNRIGGVWHDFWENDMDTTVDTEILPAGLKRVRLSINAITSDIVNWDKPELIIGPNFDELFTRAADNGISITYMLSFWDKAYVAEGGVLPKPRFKTEEEIQRYLDYVRFIVHHFKDRVEYYEIWNEPDDTNTVQWIEVKDYVNLVKRAIPVIREEDPDAKIVVGSTPISPTYGAEKLEYLFNILQSDVMPLVDVVAWHPMYGTSPEYDREYYYNYPALVQEIKDVASANGFGGEYRADEMSWWTPENAPYDAHGIKAYSETVAAKYYARGIMMHLGMDVTAGLGWLSSSRKISFRTVQNLCTILAGAKPVSLPVEVESQATNIMSYAFTLPSGDRLFALWTNDAASDYDPGIPAKLTFPGFSAQEVVGYDVLHGLEQQMIVNSKNGNLIIPNLIVKDYPIIIRLSN